MVYLGTSSSEYELPMPKTPTKNCKRDDRLRAQTLFFDAGWSKSDIALQLNLTLEQVKYALRHRVTP
jgi:DNA-binding transcriptional regulator LsrR (DeoR family)